MKKSMKLLLFVILVTVLSIGITLKFYNSQDQQKIDKEFIITSEQFKFTPSYIIVQLNEYVRLRITSLDVPHGFQLEEFGILNQQTLPGQETVIEFRAIKIGEFQFVCTVFCGTGHPDHLGSLMVIAE